MVVKTLQIVQSFEKKIFLLWPLLTSCDKPFSTVFCSMYSSSFPNYSTSTRPHRVSRLTFLIYSLDLLHKVTYIFWTLACLVALSSYTALVSSSCTSSHDFDTHFLHFHLTMDSLCFSMWLAISTPTTDFHRLAKRHACRTKNKRFRKKIFLN